MTDIVLGIRLKADGSDLVGQVKVSEDALRKLREESAKNTGEAAKLNDAHKQMASQMNASASSIGAYTAAWSQVTDVLVKATNAAKDYIKESALLHARYETLGVVMGVVGRNAGYTAVEMNNVAEAVRKSGITMNESREVVIKLAQAQIDLSLASKLARAAQDAAVIANTNSSEALERMIHGITSGQTEVLRTMGINVSFEEGYKKLAKTLGVTTEQLTEQEKVQSRANVTLEYAVRLQGTYEAAMGTAGKQLNSLKRYTEDLKTMRGEVWNEALIIAVEAYTESLKKATAQSQALSQDGSLKEWGREILEVSAVVADALLNTWKIFRTGVEAAGSGVASAIAMTITAARKMTPLNYVMGDKETSAETMLYGFRDQARSNIAGRWGGSTNTPFADGAARVFAEKDAAAAKLYALQLKQEEDAIWGAFPGGGGAPRAAGKAAGGGAQRNGPEQEIERIEKQLAGLNKESTEYEKLIEKIVWGNEQWTDSQVRRAEAAALGIDQIKAEAKAQELAKEELKLKREEQERDNKVQEEATKLRDEHEKRVQRDGEAIADNLESIRFETTLVGKNNAEREKAIQLRKLETLAKTQRDDQAADARQQLIGALDAKAAAEAAAEAVKKSADESKRLIDETGRGITDAIMRGGADGWKSLKETMINGFKNMVLRPIIQPVITGLAGTITGALGLTGTANAAGGGSALGGLGNLLSMGKSGYEFLTGGNVMESIGSALGFGGGSLAGFGSLGIGGSGAGSLFAAEAAAQGLVGAELVATGAGAATGALSVLGPIGLAAGAALLLSGGLGGGGGGPAHTTGVDFVGSASALGAAGQWYGNAANSKESFRFPIPDGRGEERVNAFIAQTFKAMGAGAQMLGVDASVLNGKSYGFNYGTANGTPDNVLAAAQAAMGSVTDQMARDLIPGIDAMRQANESLTQTFTRMAAETQKIKLDQFNGLMSAAVQLEDHRVGLWSSDLSPLTNTQRLTFSGDQYQAALVAARGGDAKALASLQGLSTSYLQESRSYYASSADYSAIFTRVQGEMHALVNDTMTEQSIVFAEMGLTLKDININTKDIDVRIAAALQKAIDAWQAAQAAETKASTEAIVTAVTDAATVTGEVVASQNSTVYSYSDGGE